MLTQIQICMCRFLTPPVNSCINDSCRISGHADSLISHHDSTVVTVYSLSGPEIGVKHALKCRNCNYIYHYSAYGRKTSIGEKLYNQPRDLVEVSDVIYCERELYELFCSLRYISYIIYVYIIRITTHSLHCWVSFSGFSESYTEFSMKSCKQQMYMQAWMKNRKGIFILYFIVLSAACMICCLLCIFITKCIL